MERNVWYSVRRTNFQFSENARIAEQNNNQHQQQKQRKDSNNNSNNNVQKASQPIKCQITCQLSKLYTPVSVFKQPIERNFRLSATGFALNMLALLPHMLEHFDEPDEFSKTCAQNIVQVKFDSTLHTYNTYLLTLSCTVLSCGVT